MTPLHLITERIAFFRMRSSELEKAGGRKQTPGDREALIRLAHKYADLAQRMETRVTDRINGPLSPGSDTPLQSRGKPAGSAIARWETDGGAAGDRSRIAVEPIA